MLTYATLLSHFFQHSCFYSCFSFDVVESTAHEAVSSLLVVLSQMQSSLIKWPDESEQEREMKTFFDQTGIYKYVSVDTLDQRVSKLLCLLFNPAN